MEAVHLKVHGHIDADGHLRLDLPTGLPTGEAEIAVTIAPRNGKEGKGYDFSQLAGRLKWAGNAVEEQRGMRNEW
jgi:hypothetical protein